MIEDTRAKRAKVSDEPTFTLNAEEEAALLEAIAEADRGELLPAEDVLKQLP
jgi:predicted transcriptional regulator